MRTFNEIIQKVLVLLLFLCFLSFTTEAQDDIQINEFMALNQNSIIDADSSHSDWIEIYNPTSEIIYLQNYSLTDDVNTPLKWVFPDVSLLPGEYLIVFASGNDRVYENNEIHTNFRIDGAGEYLALFNGDGKAITEFSPVFPVQEVDKSFGYYEGGYVQFDVATPGEQNAVTSSITLSNPVFSHKHGFYSAPFSLTITSDVDKAEIYYTLDGSVPSVYSTYYTGPVNISTTTPVRAIAVKDDVITSKVTTSTFIFLEDVIHQSNTPTGYPAEWGPYSQIQGNSIADYEMDPELMEDPNFVKSCLEGLKDIPTMSIVTDKDNLFSHDKDETTGGIYIYTGSPAGDPIGRGWERPISMEYFDGSDTVSLQVDCGVRLQGGHGRLAEKSPKHSFLLVFKDEYGPTKLHFPLFGEGNNDKLNTVTLRAGFGYSWIHHSSTERSGAQLQQDIWGKDTQREMGYPGSHSTYVHLYINGIYWGVYAPSERMDSEFAGAYMEGKPDDFDVIKDYSEVMDGVGDSWNELIQQAGSGMDDQERYMKIQGKNPDGSRNPSYPNLLEMDNFIDYLLINYYGGNTDWDHHNWAAMRNRNTPETGFRFIVWDGEHLVKDVNGNVLNKNNSNCPTGIFNQMLANDDFKRLFADRVLLHCYNGGALTPQTAIDRWNVRSDQIEDAIVAESARWGDYRRDVHPYQTSGPFELYTKKDHWLPRRDYMLNTFFARRTDVFLEQLRDIDLYPEVDAPYILLNGEYSQNSFINSGDILSISAAVYGTTYYTLDGSDPVLWETQQLSEIKKKTFVLRKTEKRVLVPSSNIGNSWSSDVNFDDSSWEICSGSPGGVGYEKKSGYESYITLDVGDKMHTDGGNPNASCYIRIPFSVTSEDLETFSSLKLNLQYDDGFVVYLNGEKVCEAFAPSSLSWNSTATDNHEAESYEEYNISNFMDALVEGENLLAIHSLNRNTSSSDFIFNVQMEASDNPASELISESAILYTGEIALEKSVNVKSRTFLNGEWSAMANSSFILPEDYNDLMITEINYHPKATETTSDGKFEFIEIKNVGDAAINLQGIAFVAGIDYTFEKEVILGSGEFIVLASSTKNFAARYGFYAYDDYKGQLDNNGENIKAVSPLNDTIIALRYDQDEGWPINADGEGYSLVPTDINPSSNISIAEKWRASYFENGSPGMDDVLTDIPVISQYEPEKEKFELSQNYPNPFSDLTYIDYYVSENSHVNISLYSLLGQHISTLVNNDMNKGLHQVSWNRRSSQFNLSKGFYIYRMEVTNEHTSKIITKKMLIID